MKRIVVAGGSGMIGSNIATLVHLVGDDPIIADLKRSKDFPSYEMDLRNPKTCFMILQQADEVYNCAAITKGIGYSDGHHAEMFTHTTQIALNLLDAAAINKVKRFLLVSSSCVYPDVPITIPTPEFFSLTDTPEVANEGYGWAKRVSELQAGFYTDRMHIVIVRPANVYGPSYDWKSQDKHVIPSLIEKMLRGDDSVTVWGDGKQTRSFIYEDDVADLSVKLLAKGVNGEAYNLGGVEIEIGELAYKIAEICNYKGKITFDASAPQGPRRKAQDTTKLVKLIGAYDYTFLAHGLGETIDSARKELRNKR